MLVVHEAGHGIVAAILGWHVPLIVIGMGRPILVFRLGSTVVEVRVLPLEGFVVPLPKNLRAVRWKSALIYFAGPGAELLEPRLPVGLGNGDRVPFVQITGWALVVTALAKPDTVLDGQPVTILQRSEPGNTGDRVFFIAGGYLIGCLADDEAGPVAVG